MSPNAGEGVSCVVSANYVAQLGTWIPNKLWRSNSTFNLYDGRTASLLYTCAWQKGDSCTSFPDRSVARDIPVPGMLFLVWLFLAEILSLALLFLAEMLSLTLLFLAEKFSLA